MLKLPCILCDGFLEGPVHKSLLMCNKCGLYRQSQLPRKDTILKEMEDWCLQACVNEDKEKERLNAAFTQTIEPLKNYIESGKLYDVGAAGGFLMKVAQEHGFETSGNEVSIRQIAFAKERYDIDIFYGLFEDHEIEKESINVVTFWNTLEHVNDPILALQKAYDILKPNGIIYIEVPIKCHDQIIGGHYEHAHMTEFTPVTLELIRKKIGLECILEGIDNMPPIVGRPMWRKPL